ncbi:radical SAM protein [Lachnospiraceae bacterium ZAX-1]
MSNIIKFERYALVINSVCSLRCRDCYIQIHKQRNDNFPIKQISAELSEMFKLCDYCEMFCPFGGEPFLHPDLDKIILEIGKYSNQIGTLRLCSNGTIVPSKPVLSALKSIGCKSEVRYSIYGSLARNYDEAIKALDEAQIDHQAVFYDENDQYCGGWVDFRVGDECKNYSDDKLVSIHKNCNYANDIVGLDGKLYQCNIESFGVRIGHIPLVESDYVDLFSNESIEVKRKKIQEIGAHPSEACKYCNSFDVDNGNRIPAGIQLEARR